MSQARKEFPPDFFNAPRAFVSEDFAFANFSGRKLVQVYFNRCDLRGADFSNCHLEKCTFNQCKLYESQWVSSYSTDVEIFDCSMQTSNLNGSVWVNSRFRNAQLRNSQLIGALFDDHLFQAVDLTEVRGSRVAFQTGDFYNVTFADGTLDGSVWDSGSMDGVNFYGANLRGAVFSLHSMTNVRFHYADLTDTVGIVAQKGWPLSRAGLMGLVSLGDAAPGKTIYAKMKEEVESQFHPELHARKPDYFIHTCNINRKKPEEIKRIEGEICVSSWSRKRSPEFYWPKGPKNGSAYVFRGHPTACFEADAWSELLPPGMRFSPRVERGDYHHDECWLIPADAELVAVVVGSAFEVYPPTAHQIEKLGLPVLRAEELTRRARQELLLVRVREPRDVLHRTKGPRRQKRDRHTAEFNPDTRLFGIYSRRSFGPPLVVGTLHDLLGRSLTAKGSFGLAYGLHVSETDARIFFNKGGRVWSGDRYYLAPVPQPMSSTSMKAGGMGRVR